jgi:hypothetical protein
MKLSKINKVFWVFLIICVYNPIQLSLASSLERYLNYEISGSNPSMNLAANQETNVFQGEGLGSEEYTCIMGMDQAHKYLGYGTLLFAAATAVSGGNNMFHKGAGIATAAMAVAACTTGFIQYDNYFDIHKGLSAHNVHIVLGTLATIGFVTTAALALSSNDKGHVGIGVGSTALLVVPIVVINW